MTVRLLYQKKSNSNIHYLVTTPTNSINSHLHKTLLNITSMCDDSMQVTALTILSLYVTMYIWPFLPCVVLDALVHQGMLASQCKNASKTNNIMNDSMDKTLPSFMRDLISEISNRKWKDISKITSGLKLCHPGDMSIIQNYKSRPIMVR